MTLFRELPEDRRDRFVDVSTKQQDLVRNAHMSLAERARAFLTSILFLGLLLALFLLHERAYASKDLRISATCFLVGLFLVGLLHAANFEMSRVVLFRTVEKLRLIFRNVVPIEEIDVPPINIRLASSISVLAYAAFALWVTGVSFALPVIYAQTVSPTRPEVEIGSPSQPQSEIQSQSPANGGETTASTPSGIKASRAEWSNTDTITSAIGFAQFLALLFTWKVMRDASRRQLRAYVLPFSFSLNDGTTIEPKNPALANTPGIWLEIKNSGQTPAYGLISWWEIQVIEPLNEDKLVVPALANISSQTLPPNGITTKGLWFHRVLTQQELSDVHQRVRHIFAHGRIEYWDVFKKKRYTNFRVSYAGSFPPVGTPVMSFRNC